MFIRFLDVKGGMVLQGSQFYTHCSLESGVASSAYCQAQRAALDQLPQIPFCIQGQGGGQNLDLGGSCTGLRVFPPYGP